jgi:tryptophan 2,3-dioxygenase
MTDNSVDPQLVEQLKKLQAKYAVMGQDLSSYLDGLLYSDFLTYWDYIHLDTLLSLQTPKTHFTDEKVFIIYHQITELYFRLILWELEQISFKVDLTADFFIQRIDRVIRYFKHLTNSFEIMVDGLDREQFLKFRMALLPSSGFQSAQYRLIEIQSTDMIYLVSEESREELQNEKNMRRMLEKLYWRDGATELASGKKTLTLQQFETKYMETFFEAGQLYESRNLRQLYISRFRDSPQKNAIVQRLRMYDLLANVHWRLAHLKSASKYLLKDPQEIKATGGTNWLKYLPPRFQRIMFFPELWKETEKAEWGKAALVNSDTWV